jgi:hypothetical protein
VLLNYKRKWPSLENNVSRPLLKTSVLHLTICRMMPKCDICGKAFSRSDSLKRHKRQQHKDDELENDEPTSEDEVSDEESVKGSNDESADADNDNDDEGDDYIQNVINDIFDEYDNVVQGHVPEPQTLEEYNKNNSIEKFLRDKLITQFAEDFNITNSWNDLNVTAKWSKLAQKRMAEDEVDGLTAIKRILRKDAIIEEWISEELDDMHNKEDDDSEDDGQTAY